MRTTLLAAASSALMATALLSGDVRDGSTVTVDTDGEGGRVALR